MGGPLPRMPVPYAYMNRLAPPVIFAESCKTRSWTVSPTLNVVAYRSGFDFIPVVRL